MAEMSLDDKITIGQLVAKLNECQAERIGTLIACLAESNDIGTKKQVMLLGNFEQLSKLEKQVVTKEFWENKEETE